MSPLRLNLVAVSTHRIRLMLYAVGWLMLVIGAAWTLGFAITGLWLLSAMDMVVAMAGAIVLWCVSHNYLRLAALLSICCGYLIICSIAFFADVPDGNHPRSIHLFMLSMAFSSYLVLQLEHRLIRIGVPGLCMVTYLVLDSTSFGYPQAFAVPGEHRALSIWFSNLSALLYLFVVMLIMHSDIRLRTALEADLQTALIDRQLVLYYQPQVNYSGEVVGAEGLVRWIHPQHGLVPPGNFIPLAEQCNLVSDLGRYVLAEACQQLATWSRHADLAHLKISVNISAMHLHEETFVDDIVMALQATEADPTRLKIEITETMLVNNTEDIILKITVLRQRGISVSLDDFGTGYSSLNYLKHLPLDELKIDKSFIDNLRSDSSASDMAIARTIVSLTHNLGLHVIAEGVETQEQRELLESIGCHSYQGYLYAKPLPIGDFEQFLFERSAADIIPLPANVVSHKLV